ncbi:MAG: nucleotide exchange factor GrpE [Myxococcota bacterium]
MPVNTVVEVLEKGYQLRSRLIRPARVVVSVSSSQEADEKGEDETTE